MPPEETKNNPLFNPLKVEIDPIFKGNQETKTPVGSGAFGVLNNQNYIPVQTGTLEPLPSQHNPNQPSSIVRTYKGDLESAIQANHLSSINIAMAENEKMHSQLESGTKTNETGQSEEYSKSRIIIFISLILILIGGAGILAVYLLKNQNTNTVVQTIELPSLITTEYRDELNINSIAKGKFTSALSSKLNDISIPVNNLYNTYITIGTSSAKRLITSSEFITLAELKMPDLVKRTLAPDFMVGMFSFAEDLPFIIFKTTYFENTYAGMLDWEKDLATDLRLLFRLNYNQTLKFEDGVIINKDVRIIRDETGKTILLYSIIDKNTIVITVNDVVFKELVNRLNKEKGLKR